MAQPFLPRVLVYKDFQQPSTATIGPQRACVVGPHAQLVRHSDADERRLGSLGDVNSLSSTEFTPWPSLASGGVVDSTFVRLFVDGAKLGYFNKTVGGSAITVNPSKHNRITIAGAAGFAVNGSHPRLSGLLGRDVIVGDRVRLTADPGGGSVQFESAIIGVTGTLGASAIGAAAAMDGNATTKVAAVVAAQVGGDVNCAAMSGSAASYNGLAHGAVSDVYTITVIQGSTGHNPTTARLRIRSASGLDDVDNFIPGADGVLKTVGARGLQIAVDLDTGSCDLLVNQSWTLTVDQAFTRPTPTAGGAFVGAADDVYIVTVTRGGLFADSDPAARPQWTVTTARGLDQGTPVTISATGTAYPVGSLGVTMSIGSGVTGLRKGDRFTIPVTAAAIGALNTLILADDVPTSIRGEADFDAWFYKVADVEVPAVRVGAPAGLNYELDAVDANRGVLVGALGALSVKLPTVVDTTGTPIPLTVLGGEAVVEYRAWIADLSGSLGLVSQISELPGLISGDIDPANPLSWAVSRALIGSGGVAVAYIAVADPDDLQSWALSLDKLVGREDVYNIVPLTENTAVLDLVVAHVNQQSSAETGRERAVVWGLSPKLRTPIVNPSTSTDGQIVLASLAANPDSPSGAITLITDHTDNGKFITAGVRPGDEVRYAYVSTLGGELYSSYTVARVLSETTLLLRTGPLVDSPQPSRVEIWRDFDNAGIRDDLKARAAALSNSRVVAVWSDLFGVANQRTKMYYLAAAIAGTYSGILPHQSLTNVEIGGFTDIADSVGAFGENDVADLAGNGVLVVSRDANVANNAIVCRLDCTTDVSSIISREEMVRRNTDSMVKFVRSRLYSLLGSSNVVTALESLVRVELGAAHSVLKASGFTQRLGSQLVDATITDVRRHAVLADHLVVGVDWVVPLPTGGIHLHINIVA